MEEQDIKIEDLQDELAISTGYLIGVTLLQDGILKSHLLTSNFPIGDIEKSISDLVGLALPSSKITIERKIVINEDQK